MNRLHLEHGARRALAALLATALWTSSAFAAPKAELWERWTANDPASTVVVDHAPWTALLQTHLVPGSDGINRFRYAVGTGRSRAALRAYIEGLARVPIDACNRTEQRAFWINLYNALTVDVVLAHYPVESIRDIGISPGFFTIGPWDKKLVTVAGTELSLNDIEHRILRPIWRDSRIHYAVNCASLGCPNLQPEAYTGANAEALLERAAVEFVNHPRGVDVAAGRPVVSSIYHWFREDFGDSEAGVIAHLLRFAKPPLAAVLRSAGGLGGHDYDWRLNDAQ